MRESFSIMGALQNKTVTFLSTDTSQVLTTAISAASTAVTNFGQTKAAMISVESNPVRFAFGVAASTTKGHVIAAGGSIRLTDHSFIAGAQFISASAGNHGRLQVSLEY